MVEHRHLPACLFGGGVQGYERKVNLALLSGGAVRGERSQEQSGFPPCRRQRAKPAPDLSTRQSAGKIREVSARGAFCCSCANPLMAARLTPDTLPGVGFIRNAADPARAPRPVPSTLARAQPARPLRARPRHVPRLRPAARRHRTLPADERWYDPARQTWRDRQSV
jgi:hypothetical protein